MQRWLVFMFSQRFANALRPHPQLLCKLASLDRAIAEVTALMSAKVGMSRQLRCSQGAFCNPKHNPLAIPPAALPGLPLMRNPRRTDALATLTRLNPQADDSLARDLERRVAALCRQQDITSEGLRSLSGTAMKRADEHASAIQRLTLVGGAQGRAGQWGWGRGECFLGGSWAVGGGPTIQFQRLVSTAAVCILPVWHDGLQVSYAESACPVTKTPLRSLFGWLRVQAVSGNLEDRPTVTAVKHMVETAALEVGAGLPFVASWSEVAALAGAAPLAFPAARDVGTSRSASSRFRG